MRTFPLYNRTQREAQATRPSDIYHKKNSKLTQMAFFTSPSHTAAPPPPSSPCQKIIRVLNTRLPVRPGTGGRDRQRDRQRDRRRDRQSRARVGQQRRLLHSQALHTIVRAGIAAAYIHATAEQLYAGNFVGRVSPHSICFGSHANQRTERAMS